MELLEVGMATFTSFQVTKLILLVEFIGEFGLLFLFLNQKRQELGKITWQISLRTGHLIFVAFFFFFLIIGLDSYLLEAISIHFCSLTVINDSVTVEIIFKLGFPEDIPAGLCNYYVWFQLNSRFLLCRLARNFWVTQIRSIWFSK